MTDQKPTIEELRELARKGLLDEIPLCRLCGTDQETDLFPCHVCGVKLRAGDELREHVFTAHSVAEIDQAYPGLREDTERYVREALKP